MNAETLGAAGTARTGSRQLAHPAPAASAAPARSAVRVRLGTKAETLSRLRPLVRKSSVLDLYAFSVREWQVRSREIVASIERRFGGGRLVVRSSAIGEDGATSSMAGAYTSRLGVDGADGGAVAGAVREVIASYAGDPRDQVLVQPMLSRIVMSGVAMTRDLNDGAPYYVINYDDESGKTDTITGGIGVNKTVYVFRAVEPVHVDSERIARVLRMAQELEALCGGMPLDLEFCLAASGELFLLQARPISVAEQWEPDVAPRVSERLPLIAAFVRQRSRERSTVLGRRTILGVMPDWNPAEIIGTTPGVLATSLYRELITRSVWREARARMGYREIPGEELMVVLSGRPYIDTRNSFNSLLPACLPDAVAARLVDAWLDRLDTHPELHDKVEFEVAQTCLDFSFEETFAARYGDRLTADDRERLREDLRSVTARALELGPAGTMPWAEARIEQLARWQANRVFPSEGRAADSNPVAEAASLLEECRVYGTLPFAVLARHAFIAESLLRSAVERGALAPERLSAWKRSVHTISSEFGDTLRAVSAGETSRQEFLARFGHLRPGTYDVRSLSYFDRPEIFEGCLPAAGERRQERFALATSERRALDRELAVLRIGAVDAGHLLGYAARAIRGREYAKFVFTRNLSAALELLAQWARARGLTREELSHLSWSTLCDTLSSSPRSADPDHLRELVERGREEGRLARAIKLGYLIRDESDVYVVPQHRSTPNFIGSEHVHGTILEVDATTCGEVDLRDRIVCIENADPGYDWIFSKGIRGLITRYGGANSHMAIRCAEFGLSAAIGCGTQVFERIVAAGEVDLNCAERVLRPLHEH